VLPNATNTPFDSITAEDAPSDSSWRITSASSAPGSCGSNAPAAKGPLPTIPPFALPHKQFTSDILIDKTKDFLGSDKSYRETVRHQGKDLVYDDRQDHPLANRPAALAHSTPWRWLCWLASLTLTRRAASQLICQKDPDDDGHKRVIPIEPQKYRSQQRCQSLQEAARMLLIEADFQRHFQKKIFPTFATSMGWR